MAPWILVELLAEQRSQEAERAAQRAATLAGTESASRGALAALRSRLARTLFAAAVRLDRTVAGNGAARTAGRAA